MEETPLTLWGEKRNRCTVNWDNIYTPKRPTAAWGVMQVHKINTVVVTFTLEAFPWPSLSSCLFPTANQLSLCLVPIPTQINSYSFYLFLFLFSSYGLSVLFTLVRGYFILMPSTPGFLWGRNQWLLSSLRQHIWLPVRALLSDFLAGTYKAKDCDGPDQATVCLPCASGTFTAVDNTMSKCFRCTRCRTGELLSHLQDRRKMVLDEGWRGWQGERGSLGK